MLNESVLWLNNIHLQIKKIGRYGTFGFNNEVLSLTMATTCSQSPEAVAFFSQLQIAKVNVNE